MKKILFLLTGTLLILTGCASKEEKFLKGEWGGGDSDITVVYDDENETMYKNGESQGTYPYDIVEVDGEKILVKTYGYGTGGVLFTEYTINKKEDTLYLGDYWTEDSSGSVISEGVGDEVLERLDDNSEDIIAWVFCIVAVLGFIALYYYRNHYKKKKDNERELL